MDLLQAAHNTHFKSWSEPLSVQAQINLVDKLVRAGLKRETAQAYVDTMHIPKPGMAFGAAHVEDLVDLVDRALGPGNHRIILEIETEAPGDHHVSITIKELGQASWEKEG